MPSSSRDRLKALDAVRGIAAVMVVLFHYTSHYSKVSMLEYRPSVVVEWGYLGVHFFFMVSGFVIFMTLRRTENGMDFLVSRFSRLYPAFWLAVLLTATLAALFGPPRMVRSWSEVAVNLTMLQDFVKVPPVDGVYWTLTYELMFYTWMYLAFRLKLLTHIQGIVAVWLLLATGSHVSEIVFNYFPWKITFFLLLNYAHLFAAGILFFLIFSGKATRLTYWLLAACAANQILVSTLFETAFVFGFFCLFYLICIGKDRFLHLGILTFFGSISYTLYLLHQNIGFIIMDFLRGSGMHANIAVIITLACAIALAWLATRLVEQPAMKAIRDRYRSRSQRATTIASTKA